MKLQTYSLEMSNTPQFVISESIVGWKTKAWTEGCEKRKSVWVFLDYNMELSALELDFPKYCWLCEPSFYSIQRWDCPQWGSPHPILSEHPPHDTTGCRTPSPNLIVIFFSVCSGFTRGVNCTQYDERLNKLTCAKPNYLKEIIYIYLGSV